MHSIRSVIVAVGNSAVVVAAAAAADNDDAVGNCVVTCQLRRCLAKRLPVC